MNFTELASIGAVSGLAIAAPTVMLTDAGYAMMGVVASAMITAIATVVVAVIGFRARATGKAEAKAAEDEADKKPDAEFYGQLLTEITRLNKELDKAHAKIQRLQSEKKP